MNRFLGFCSRLAVPALAILLGGYVLATCLSPTTQWDFKIFYAAAAAHRLGLNPYDPAALSVVAGEPVSLSFVYPPHALYVFRPFTWFDLPAALILFAALKTAAAVVLVLLWRRMFNLGGHLALFLLFVPLAFNGAVLGDLRSGNISLFEQLFIWAGFYCYLRGQAGGFCAAILCAASMKLVPVLLLGFLLTTRRRRDAAWLAGGAMLVAVAVVLSAVVWPELSREFLESVKRVEGERGVFNPATWALIRDVGGWFAARLGLTIPSVLLLTAYAAVAGGAVVVSFLAIRRTWTGDDLQANLWRICVVCFLYAIAVPRFKNYSYILLLGPTFYLIISARLPSAVLLTCLLTMIPTHTNFIVFGKILEPFYRLLLEYYPLVLAWLLWAWCCYLLLQPHPESKTKSPCPDQNLI